MPFITSLLTALIALFIYHKTDKIPGRNRFAVRGVTLLIFVVAAIAAVFRNIVIVSTGNVGVVEFFGQMNNRPLNPGIHLVNPFSKVEFYSTRLKDVKETIEATSQEGLAFNVDVSLQYRVDSRKAVEIYQNLGNNETEIVISRFRSIVREVTASYPAEAIYSTKRQEVASRIREQLSKQLSPLGFVLDGAYLRQVVLPETLQAAIQEKLKAEQQSRQMSFTLTQTRQESERKRVEARGTADAQAILALSLTPSILQLRSIEAMEKLATSNNAKVLIVGGGQSGLPTILSLDSVMSDNPQP